MQLINNNYEMTEEQSAELQIKVCSVSDMVNIMHDYCKFNIENKKISPLLTLTSQIKSEMLKITDIF